MAAFDDDGGLKCGICLELFQDPRSLPCLHTFCRECIQCSLNEENHSLKCPVCRAKHELSEGAGLLPVNQYALQELPLKRLQQQREDNGGPHQLVECKSCGELAGPVVAWCEDCDGDICQSCVSQHSKLVIFRDHLVKPYKKFRLSFLAEDDSEASELIVCPEKHNLSRCLRHGNEKLKFLCTTCSELVCSDCLLLGSHVGHSKELVEGAKPRLVRKMQKLVTVKEIKKQEFSQHLEKAERAVSKALEYKELMEMKVNEVFDGFAASVEEQRNKALQSVSLGMKKIWAQKEMMEVSLAQLDSFTRFTDHTHKCMAEARFVAMAAQGIKLMKQLENTHGNENSLNHRTCLGFRYTSGSSCFPQLFSFGEPSFKFSPAPEARMLQFHFGMNTIKIKVSLVAGKLPVAFPSILTDSCKLAVVATYQKMKIHAEVSPANQSSWNVVFTIDWKDMVDNTLPINCKLSGPVAIETDISYDTYMSRE